MKQFWEEMDFSLTTDLSNSSEEKCKARYVAKGYSQLKDIDFKETFSTT